ncbi:MAG: hypothetical protein HY809_01780 [Nitrospirae bacterium]|nr:hypothetical protein [Nitrospirota bacterium]
MNDNIKKEIFPILCLLAAAVMAFIYFSAPERPLFMETQLKWWEEFLNALSGR